LNPDIQILSFRPELAVWFKRINLEWLNHYFEVTPNDLEILDHPDRLIRDGARILFIRYNGVIAGTAALVRKNSSEVELIKMGVSFQYHGRGLGAKLMDALLRQAREMGARKITLETASVLQSAIRLYQGVGFVQTGPEELHPLFKRMTFKMEKTII
jgi:ribosomal protein S18 acetylase RimI-like enzyme